MVYFANSAINRLYAHTALQGLAENAGGAFVFVYLLRAGFGVPTVLCTLAALLMFRLGFRQVVVPFAKHWGVRAGIILGTLLVAISYVALAFVDAPDFRLAIYMLLAACGEAFYWACFHAAMASLGDNHARGAQASAIQLVYALTSVVGPLAGGFALALLGPKAAFFTAAAVQVLAIWPCRQLPEMMISPESRLDASAARTAAMAYFCDGLLSAGNAFSWSLALFITLGEKFQSYGLAQALAALCGAVMALGLGQLIDRGHPKRSAAIGLSCMGLAVLFKAVAYHSTFSAILALAAGAVAGPIYSSAYNARIYNLAKASGDALRFHVSGEGGWDFGAALGAVAAASLVQLGFGFSWPIALALLGLAGVGAVIRQSYQKPVPSLRV